MRLFHISFHFVFGFSWKSSRTWSPSSRWPSRTWMQRSQRPSWTRPNIHTGPTSPLLICNGINGYWLRNKYYVFQLQPLNDSIHQKDMQIDRLHSFIGAECRRKQLPVEGSAALVFTLTVDLSCVYIRRLKHTVSILWWRRRGFMQEGWKI